MAHCASGNALNPGNYPVGVAFAPPNGNPNQPAVFHLVNLPTPRRQIAYAAYVKTDEASSGELSRRTLDRFLAEKKPLGDSDLGILGELDAREVSCFASRYFRSMEDGKVEEDPDQETPLGRRLLARHSSRFGAICAQLARDGTREAAPGLVEAIRQGKFNSPTPLSPYRLPWLAALAIAHRDPWPDVHAWLAENIDNRQTLIIDRDDAVEIGATAAGLLLARHGKRPQAFGLQSLDDPQLVDLKLPGFRYADHGYMVPEDAVQKVRQWWKRHK